MTSLNVLVVDDSLLTIKRLEQMLGDLGHKVVRVAATGSQAVAAYETCKPDLVTMDISMPDMDGIEATRRIMQQFPDATIIMVTAHGQEKMVVDALAEGAKGYVLKPIKMESLKSSIDKALQVKRSA